MSFEMLVRGYLLDTQLKVFNFYFITLYINQDDFDYNVKGLYLEFQRLEQLVNASSLQVSVRTCL